MSCLLATRTAPAAGAGEPGRELRSRRNPRAFPFSHSSPALSGCCRSSDVGVWRAPSDSCGELEDGRVDPLRGSLFSKGVWSKRSLVAKLIPD